MPSGSVVVVRYDDQDITTDILPKTARFESQNNAVPGTFSFTVKDINHTHGFTTGRIVTLELDGTLIYGGYVMQVARSYPFAAMDTTTGDPTEMARYWRIQGADFNILFDKRVLRRPFDYYHQIPNFTGDKMDGFLIRKMCEDYLDVPEVDGSTYVDDIKPPFNASGVPDEAREGAWLQQGTPWRKQMEDFSQFTGSIWYLAPKPEGPEQIALHHHAIEDVVNRWGFSDAPNQGDTVSTTPGYQNVTIGPREIDATQAGDHMVNDAFVWGGSQWAGKGGTVFARETNPASITAHGRWQLAETGFGQEGYKLQESVNVRADIIVNGPPGAVGADQNRGLRYAQWQFRFAWFAHDVPTLSGIRNHIVPGTLVTIQLAVFGSGDTPLVQLLPLRSVSISFPELDPTGHGYVRFEGFFGLQPDDPYSLWRFLLRNRARIINPALTFVDEDTPGTLYGATGNFRPTPTPNGSTTLFSIPFGYVVDSTRVYLREPGFTGALTLFQGSDYEETDPLAGTITLNVAPPTGASLLVTCRTLSS